MPITFVPLVIRDVYYLFKDIFTEHNMGYVDSCAMLLFFLTGSTSLCELVRNCPWAPSVSALSRLSKEFKPNRFMRRNRERILKHLSNKSHGDFCYAVDDTANPKYGTHGDYFGSSGGRFFGQKILVLVIVDLKTRISYPISYIFLTGKKDPHHIPAHYRAIDLIHEALHFGFPPLPITSDSWFDSKEFIESVKQLGCEFAGEMKALRLARKNINPQCSRKKLSAWFEDQIRKRLPQNNFQKRKEKRGKAFSEMDLFINGLFIPLKIIAVYNRINGVTAFAYYATTDLSMTGVTLWKFARARWAIEVLFRDLKQSLGFGFLSSGGEGGAHLAVCLPLILLTSIRTNSKDIWEIEGKESLGTTVKKHRENAFSRTIDHLVHNPTSLKVQILKARRKNPNQKPTNFCGERKAA